MGNLIRMDIYRMRKAKSFWACIITAFVFALGQTPMLKLLAVLGKMLTGDEIVFPAASLAVSKDGKQDSRDDKGEGK